MKSLFNLALLTSIAAALSITFVNTSLIELAVPIALIILVFMSKNDHNSQMLTLCFAFVFVITSVAMYVLDAVIKPAEPNVFYQNIYAFLINLSLSLILLFLLKHRMTVAVLLTRGKSASVFEKNYAEGPLYLLVLFLVFVDLMALLENFIRNLEHIGVNEETAKIFWEWTFFYDYFEYLKAVPIFLCVALLYVGLIVRTRRQPIQSQP
ncbi:hypothetical protein EXT47_22655 [Pseudoalteromonas sp. CO342X]|uniref:hypothetical protein n=1 Tax=Pseudoalteromonas sp. CO342X TaxID=1777270 RepID=UPI001023B966|nr:hypothetical protein [Pseudoalteromonas sp. CO342X]RZG12097.1 hypothetical protein EXT47_22655 [Pseudoalteromonas sp. CO342X]